LDKTILVVGGGIAGLTAAWLLRRKFPSIGVTVVERAPHVGGLLTTFDYGRFGQFDCGMHWMTETGVKEIDALHFGLLPESDWVLLEGSRRDISGLFYAGRLQENSQFPDLRYFERGRYLACVGDFFANLNRPPCTSEDSLLGHARTRFGSEIADTVIAPIAAKVHGVGAEVLDPMARYLPLLDRVILFDEDLTLDLMASPRLRERLAFPEQRRLPLSYSSGRRSFYPRQYGIGKVINALVAQLQEMGVEFLTSAKILALKRSGSLIDQVEIEGGTGERRMFGPVQQMIWTADAFPLAGMLGLPLPQRTPPNRRTVIVSMLLKEPPRMGDLYCFFCADAPHASYRITNFSSFCPEAPRADGYPISVELLVDWAQAKEQDEYAAQAAREILAFGLITSPDDVVFARAEPLAAGFPSIARGSIKLVETVRDAINGQKIDNLIRGGILAKPNQFFQHDVLVDLHAQISGL
jgi:protoporphyrinogen oxidase